MSSARNVVLRRIRDATADVPCTEPPSWQPLDHGTGLARSPRLSHEDITRQFIDRLIDYGAVVAQIEQPTVIPRVVDDFCKRFDIDQIVCAADFPETWRPHAADCVVDDPPLSSFDLDQADAVVSSAALGIAETGTIVLDAGPGQGRRALTLVPDIHICVLCASALSATVSEAFERLAVAARLGRPLTLISGPSATSDIEFRRIVGVHGPRTLAVGLVRDDLMVRRA